MNEYSYIGPVTEFGKCIANQWQGKTRAISEKKARTNLEYQFKQKTNRNPNTQIKLPGKITVV